MKYVNLTPHEIAIETLDGVVVRFPSKGTARVSQSSQVVGTTDEKILIKKNVYGDIEGLPEPEEDTIYIVSMLVAQIAKRSDVLSPDSGPTAHRDPYSGMIQFVRSLVAW